MLSLDIYFAVNKFFFNNSAIHQIYKDKGKYNLSYFMPKVLLSFFIAYFIIFLIRYFSSSERYLIKIKNEKKDSNLTKLASNARRCLIIQYTIFYTTSFIFIVIFWYYLSSFCAIYQNTQIYLLKSTLISLGIAIIFPFIYNLIPSFIRIYSSKNQKEFFYKCSFILQIF